MSSIGVIFPYKRNGVWAFDDRSVGLVQEPFVDPTLLVATVCSSGIREASEASLPENRSLVTGFRIGSGLCGGGNPASRRNSN